MKYTPKVGDRVRLEKWHDDEYVDVLGIGQSKFFGRDDAGYESSWVIDCDWIKVAVRPQLKLPTLWARVAPHRFNARSHSYHVTNHSLLAAAQYEDHRYYGGKAVAFVQYVPHMDSVVWVNEVTA